jgi:hypothetical protein
MSRKTKCFRCKTEKVVGKEIARADLRAICFDCLTGRTTQEAAAAVNAPVVPNAPNRVIKAPLNRRHAADNRE